MTFMQKFAETLQKEAKKEKDKNYDYGALYRERLLKKRKQKTTITRLEKPTNIARAKSLGYKAKQGMFVVEVKVAKGSGIKKRPSSGRKPKRMAIRDITRRISKQRIAEQRASKKYPNCEVMGSYWIGEDGINHYYEIIMADAQNPALKKDKNLRKALAKKSRAERGLTSAGKKNRGLKKGKGHEKNYPSLRAHSRKAK